METRGGHGAAVVPEDAPELGTDSGQAEAVLLVAMKNNVCSELSSLHL